MMPKPIAWCASLLALGTLLLDSARASAESWQAGNTAEVAGLKVTFSKPVLVARSKGYLWFPTLVKLSSGELLAKMSDYADMHVAGATSHVAWSADGGLTWCAPIKALGGNGSATLPNGDTLLMPYYLRPVGSGVMGALYEICPKGRRSLEVVKPGITIEGWPRPDQSFAPKLGLSGFVCNGQIVPLKEKGYLATLYGHFRGTKRYSLVASESPDGVRWKIRTVIADENCELPGGEGPCESAICRLKDGRLLCVFRLASAVPYGHCFSADEGHTWTRPTAIPGAFSVEPSLVVMPDGWVALSGGRPGLFLWLNPDGMATTWHKLDVLANHNTHRPEEPIQKPGNTSSYTEIVALDDSHLLYIYDRIPFGWSAIPSQSPETNSVWVIRVTLGGPAAAPTTTPAAGTETTLRADFASAPAAFQTRPLWFWNGTPERRKTSEIMERSRESGYAGFGILPTHGKPSFMSPEFLDQYAHAIDEAARLGLTMCLYDELWFPSGAAGGQLAKQHSEALSRRLDLEAHDIEGPAKVERPVPAGDLMAAVAMHAKSFERVNLADHVRDGALAWDAPAGPWKIMFFTCVVDGARGLVDYLDPEAVKKFIGLTYEKYYQRFPGRFGTTIDSAFYDEPTMHWLKGGRAWTPQFNRKFAARHGVDPALFYPALWFDIGPETAAARNILFGFRADLYADGFVKTIAEWCRRHGIALTGHQDQEEVVNPVGLCGDLMKSMRDQDIPGVDQIGTYGRGSRAYKVISSIAYNYDRPLVMTECYGAMKDLPLANLYREAMDQFAKGINMMVPHAVWYDADKKIIPPELSWRTPPYAAELPQYNRYMARLQRMLQGGRHMADLGVLYPIATLQAGYHFDGPLAPYVGGVIPPEADYMTVGERLALNVRRDFTFLHPDVLDAKCTVDGPTLRLNNRVNYEQYQILVIPGSRAIHASNLAKIRDFYEQGGVVLATTRLPECSAEPGKDAVVRETIAAMFAVRPGQADEVRMGASSAWAGGGHEPAMAADGDPETRWNSAARAGGNQWLEVEFDTPRTFCRTVVRETFDRTRAYRIESWDGSRWVPCARGQRLGDEKIDTFQPITATKVRLFLETISSDCVSIREFEVLDGKGANLVQAGAAFSVRTNAKGGRAYFLPRPTAAAIQAVLDDAKLVPDVRFEEPVRTSGGNLSYIHKVLDRRDLWFFGNSSDSPVEVPVRLRGKHVLERWDPHTGTIESQPAEIARDGNAEVTRVRLALGPVRSVFLIGSPRAIAAKERP